MFVAQTVRLIATDPAAPLDLPAWCHLTGHTYLGTVDGQQRSTYAIYTAAAPTATHPNRPWHAPPAAP